MCVLVVWQAGGSESTNLDVTRWPRLMGVVCSRKNIVFRKGFNDLFGSRRCLFVMSRLTLTWWGRKSSKAGGAGVKVQILMCRGGPSWWELCAVGSLLCWEWVLMICSGVEVVYLRCPGWFRDDGGLVRWVPGVLRWRRVWKGFRGVVEEHVCVWRLGRLGEVPWWLRALKAGASLWWMMGRGAPPPGVKSRVFVCFC